MATYMAVTLYMTRLDTMQALRQEEIATLIPFIMPVFERQRIIVVGWGMCGLGYMEPQYLPKNKLKLYLKLGKVADIVPLYESLVISDTWKMNIDGIEVISSQQIFDTKMKKKVSWAAELERILVF
jgi:hypothetical protein